jgi:hypothetical protein
MSGAVAAHAAYNGSGTQGLAVTNKIQDQEGDVMSVFWNKNDTTRQLLHGSTILEVPASGGSGNVSNWNSTQIFDINNDIDCLGDMYLEFSLDGSEVADDVAFYFEPQVIASFIQRVEFQVGTQIWQTLENADIMGLAATEMSEGVYHEFSNQVSGRYLLDGSSVSSVYDRVYGQYVAATATEPNAFKDSGVASDGNVEYKSRVAYVPLKMFTKSIAPELQHYSEKIEGGYLMAAAPNQQVKIKVYIGTQPTTTFGTAGSPPTNALGSAALNLNIRLYAKNIVMCNEEREQMKDMPMGIPKRIKTTQNANSNVSDKSGVQVIDIDHFSLYASHLLLTFPKAMYKKIEGVELLLNSSSFSGELPTSLLEIISSSMNLYNNNYVVNGEDIDRHDTIVFPLASRAYSGSAVPLNRFDNIRLKIRHSGMDTGSFNITCVGETTALYKGGAASLAMY